MSLLTPSANAKKPPVSLAPFNSDPYSELKKPGVIQSIAITSAETLKDLRIQFASVLAHEVRNPLTNINLAVVMLGSVIENSEQKTYLDIISRSSIRINELLNDLLKYQQTEEILSERYSIHELMDEVLEMANDRIQLKHIRVIKEYIGLDFAITLSRTKMKMALTNLLVNAVEAMTREDGRLVLTTRSTPDKYVIQIEDNGCGINPENLKNIFKPYYTNKPNGLGLGLATTHDFLRSANVDISVESEEGVSTRFVLSFDRLVN